MCGGGIGSQVMSSVVTSKGIFRVSPGLRAGASSHAHGPFFLKKIKKYGMLVEYLFFNEFLR